MKAKILKSTTAKTNLSLAIKADTLAKEYLGAKDSAKAYEQRAARANDDIKTLAHKHGQKHGSEVIVEGAVYEVGFLTVPASQGVDITKARKLLPLKTFNKILALAIDETKLRNLVEAGEINAETFNKMLVPTKAGCERIIVRAKK
jgi:hypothetical protein